jgi:hypothetical protein
LGDDRDREKGEMVVAAHIHSVDGTGVEVQKSASSGQSFLWRRRKRSRRGKRESEGEAAKMRWKRSYVRESACDERERERETNE